MPGSECLSSAVVASACLNDGAVGSECSSDIVVASAHADDGSVGSECLSGDMVAPAHLGGCAAGGRRLLGVGVAPALPVVEAFGRKQALVVVAALGFAVAGRALSETSRILQGSSLPEGREEVLLFFQARLFSCEEF